MMSDKESNYALPSLSAETALWRNVSKNSGAILDEETTGDGALRTDCK